MSNSSWWFIWIQPTIVLFGILCIKCTDAQTSIGLAVGIYTTMAIIIGIDLCLIVLIIYLCCKLSIRKVQQFTTEDAL